MQCIRRWDTYYTISLWGYGMMVEREGFGGATRPKQSAGEGIIVYISRPGQIWADPGFLVTYFYAG